MKNTQFKFLSEAAISRADLDKYSKINPGKKRAQDLYELIQNDFKFPTIATSRFKGQTISLRFISKEIKRLYQKGNVKDLPSTPHFTLADNKNIEVPISALTKTQEMGSSRGVGAGTEATVAAETIQALCFAFVFNSNSLLSFDNCNVNMLEKYWIYVNSSSSFKQLQNLTHWYNKSWLNTFIESANSFFHWYKENRQYSSSTRYEFHRDDSFKNSIYKKFNSLKRELNLQIKNDKWNPGDVWMSTSYGRQSIQENISSLSNLNLKLLSLYESGDLIAISLKKLSTSSAKIEEFNKDKAKQFDVKLEYMSVNDLNQNMPFFSNSKLFIVTNLAPIEFRSFDRDRAYLAQITKKAAAGGKIGYSIISKILSDSGIQPILPQQSSITALAKNPTKEFLIEFHKLCLKHSIHLDDHQMTFEEFQYRIDNIDIANRSGFLFSKYLSVLIYDILKSNTKENVNKAIVSIFEYASSMTEYSSVFIKIS
jgi:hypothetical protein